ncbi:unnamed protein product [Miscanthus lutarioriparius]|uniref:Uncharacterized protein n=1 Tax=Miscanthus lutarioriparius TaxID=422564 RepID=A0A811RJY6_9POAL|nr:unnamed protein product [Miscanthus lutarioriparius]
MGVRGYGVGHADDGCAKGIEGHSTKTSCYRRWSRAAYQTVTFAPGTPQWSYSMVELVEQSRKNWSRAIPNRPKKRRVELQQQSQTIPSTQCTNNKEVGILAGKVILTFNELLSKYVDYCIYHFLGL